MIYVIARERDAAAQATEPITRGSVGLCVNFSFSEDWDDLAKVAVFRGSGVSVDVALLEDSCTVPPEVLTQPGSTLTIGVYGTDGAGTVVIPTVYAEAGQIKRGAEPSGIEPTPQTQPLIDQLLAAAQAARNAADEAERLAQSVRDDADNGEFDGDNGDDGNGVWYVDVQYTRTTGAGVQAQLDHMVGRSGATPAAGDLCVVSDGRFGAIDSLTLRVAVVPVLGDLSGASAYEIAVKHGYTGAETEWLESLQGEDGVAPEVTIETITGGHRITITSAAHPDGQSFDVMNGSGSGGVTVDDALSGSSTNPVQNKVIKAALESKYSKPSGGIPATDLAETYLTRHQDISGKLDKAQGAANAGKFLVVGSDGNITTVSMTAWQGGSY